MKSLLVLVSSWSRAAQLQCHLFIVKVKLAFFEGRFAGIDANELSLVSVGAWSGHNGIRVHSIGVVDRLGEVFSASSEAETLLGLAEGSSLRRALLEVEHRADLVLVG